MYIRALKQPHACSYNVTYLAIHALLLNRQRERKIACVLVRHHAVNALIGESAKTITSCISYILLSRFPSWCHQRLEES